MRNVRSVRWLLKEKAFRVTFINGKTYTGDHISLAIAYQPFLCPTLSLNY